MAKKNLCVLRYQYPPGTRIQVISSSNVKIPPNFVGVVCRIDKDGGLHLVSDSQEFVISSKDLFVSKE